MPQSSFLMPSSMTRPSFPPAFNKLKDPNITGGKISNYSKYWLYSNGVSATSMPLGAGAVDLVEDQNGNLYISIPDANIIKKIDTNGIITIYAGVAGDVGYNGDDKLATEASLNYPYGLAIDSNGNLYFVDRNNHVVRKIDSNGIISRVAGTTGDSGYSGDGGSALEAKLQEPMSLEFDSAGNLFIGEKYRIRKIDTNGIITTFAGDGSDAYKGDGGTATSAGLYRPTSMTFDRQGNLYFADYSHNVVRKKLTLVVKLLFFMVLQGLLVIPQMTLKGYIHLLEFLMSVLKLILAAKMRIIYT